MQWRAQIVRRLAGDFVQRVRIALSLSGDDAAAIVDQITADIAELICGYVCARLGIEYEGPGASPEVRGNDKAAKARAKSPWRHGLGGIGKRPGYEKTPP